MSPLDTNSGQMPPFIHVIQDEPVLHSNVLAVRDTHLVCVHQLQCSCIVTIQRHWHLCSPHYVEQLAHPQHLLDSRRCRDELCLRGRLGNNRLQPGAPYDGRIIHSQQEFRGALPQHQIGCKVSIGVCRYAEASSTVVRQRTAWEEDTCGS